MMIMMMVMIVVVVWIEMNECGISSLVFDHFVMMIVDLV